MEMYKGEKGYIFISYAHSDFEYVYPIICRLQYDGYRIWFDESVEVGKKWAMNIVEHLNSSSCVIAFLSENYLISENCIDEIEHAKNKKIPTIIIHLEELRLPEWFLMRHGRTQAILYNQFNDTEGFFKRIYEASILEECREGIAVFHNHKPANPLKELRQAEISKNNKSIEETFEKLLSELYQVLVDYREGVRVGNVEVINGKTMEMQNSLQKLYILSERYQFSNKKIATEASSIVKQYNKYVPPYNAFINADDRMSAEAQEYARKAEEEFNLLIKMIVKLLL